MPLPVLPTNQNGLLQRICGDATTITQELRRLTADKIISTHENLVDLLVTPDNMNRPSLILRTAVRHTKRISDLRGFVYGMVLAA